MKKKIQLTEEELVSIIKQVIQEQENNEGVFDGIKNVAQGLKGVWRGEGYDYFNYLSSLQNNLKNLQRLDKPNIKIMQTLQNLKTKIASSKMRQDRKDTITNAIDNAVYYFNQYSTKINQIERLAGQEIK